MAMVRTSQARRRCAQQGMTLIELLISMAIMGVVSAMLLVTWFALSNSYSYTVKSGESRDDARQAMSRMAREIRDAQFNDGTTRPAVYRASPRTIILYSTFNKQGNEDPNQAPRLVMYRLYAGGELWRFSDANGDGVIGSVSYGSASDPNPGGWPGANTNTSTAERQNGEGAMLICAHVVNDAEPSTSNPTPLFQYASFNASGNVDLENIETSSTARANVMSVQLHLLVDLNPGHSPTYMDLASSAQLRNAHQ